VNANRVQLTPLSAPLGSSRSPDKSTAQLLKASGRHTFTNWSAKANGKQQTEGADIEKARACKLFRWTENPKGKSDYDNEYYTIT
jgi:hypothetical protein